jgi:predicted RNA-binding protein YlxR (DUF448 family)
VSEKRRKHVPLRSCIACQARRPKRELIRIVRTPEGTFEIDPKGKRAGRGAYVCRNQNCLNAALQPRKLSHALKCQVGAEELSALEALGASLVADEVAVEYQTVSANDN